MITSNKHRAALLLAALISFAVLLAACGGSSTNSTTGGSTASNGASGSVQPTADSTKAAKFSQCMRAHGVPDFPDPDANGKFTLRVTPGSDLDPSSAAFKSADQACKSLQPPGFLSNSGPSPAQQNALLKFVSCMRSHGVPNFPDPNSHGAIRIGGPGIDPNSPTFQSAQQACRNLLPNGGSGIGG